MNYVCTQTAGMAFLHSTTVSRTLFPKDVPNYETGLTTPVKA